MKKVVPPKVGTNGKVSVPTDYYELSQQIAQGLQTIAQLGNNAISEVRLHFTFPAFFLTCERHTRYTVRHAMDRAQRGRARGACCSGCQW